MPKIPNPVVDQPAAARGRIPGAGFDSESDGNVVVEHRYDDPGPVSLAVVRAICALEDVDPADVPEVLDFRLHDRVDPDALDRLVGESGGNGGNGGLGTVKISFAIGPYRLGIDDTGRFEILEVDSDAEGTPRR
ncbi:HalOD1 output domain-containing protein [Halovivax sp.]|uniref:HalOD1 output domain-containing protein n=1 Tax=Halovivax sp. TaxID=1935978 RepID=UPI0025BA1C35|nr:HalOD1 output domain-containing protein [Halovivax sp.]